MAAFICTTCGTQFEPSETSPEYCPICRDERQYVNPGGQQWTTLTKLQNSHRLVVQKMEPGLFGIGMTPKFAIGQRALLVTTPNGNILWDCIPLVDDATVDIIKALGGLDAIAISHPHYYSTMAEWSQRFDNVPVYLHQADQEWVQRPYDDIIFWEGTSKELWEGVTLYNIGGHFDGGTILHWKQKEGTSGVLLAGDIIQVVPDRTHVSFMYSYPNLIPLDSATIQNIMAILAPLDYDRIYGAWWGLNISESGKQAVQTSAKRYLERVGK